MALGFYNKHFHVEVPIAWNQSMVNILRENFRAGRRKGYGGPRIFRRDGRAVLFSIA